MMLLFIVKFLTLCFSLVIYKKKTVEKMTKMLYDNGKPLFKIYERESEEKNGPIIAFNVLKPDDSYFRPGDIFRLLQ